MAKKAILDVLENTIGRYVKNLDAESLNVAVFSGKLELNSLQLNIDAVNSELARHAAEAPNLAIPFKILDGKFESFQVDVPWTRITSKPVIFRMRGLSVLMEPHDYFSEGCPVRELTLNKTMTKRIQALQRAEESRKRANALRKLAGDENEDESQKSSFGARLARRIIENLQLEIDDVRISMKGCGCSAGIVLESLSLVTTDANGSRTFVDRTVTTKSDASSFLYKFLRIKGLAIYIDEDNAYMQENMSFSEHSYIMSPLSFEAYLRQSDALKCVDFPKFFVSAKLSQVLITLSKNQLEMANRVALVIKPKKGSRPLFPEYRPAFGISAKTAKHWWKYALRCILRLTRRRSWIEFYTAFRKRQRYIPLYKRAANHKTCSWIKPLTALEMEILRKINTDNSISVQGIMMWRNMADVQVERENQKREAALEQIKEATKAKEKVRKGFRGKVEYINQDAFDHQVLRLDKELPFSLSPEEMKELETVGIEQSSDLSISSDSILCDIRFTLGSYKVVLLKEVKKPIATFAMGTCVSNFQANADGSFVFDFKLLSIAVGDNITKKSLFPSVIRSLQSSNSSSFSNAIDFTLKKSRTGDQDVSLKMVAFELIASPVFIVEVRNFFTLAKSSNTKNIVQLNPMLQQSVGGEYDIFYDAGSKMEYTTTLIEDTASAAAKVSSKFSDKLSEALKDAWNDKKVKQSTWSIDCVIHAPIILIPESSSNMYANVLVIDGGVLKIFSGKASSNVEKWFKSNKMKRYIGEEDIDYWRFEMKNLSFLIQKAGQLWNVASEGEVESSSSDGIETIIEPISIKLDLGTHNKIAENPPTCILGVLPSFSIKISPRQVKNILFVISSCVDLLKKLKGENEPSPQLSSDPFAKETLAFPKSLSREPSLVKMEGSSKTLKYEVDIIEQDIFDLFHASFALRSFTVKFYSDEGQSLEANLVSVVATSTKSSDGSLSHTLRMGWFWILDRMKLKIPRKQRLFAHSSLPHSASYYAQNDSYRVTKDLSALGVFEESYSGSSELADISIKTVPKVSQHEVVSHQIYEFYKSREKLDESLSIIDARFSSLYINWNPLAVKNLISLKNEILELFEEHLGDGETDTNTLNAAFDSSKNIIDNSNETNESSSPSAMKMFARMNKVEISLNSAIDDMPLFKLTMAETQVDFLLSKDIVDNLNATVNVGDILIESSSTRTLSLYRTILGLSSNHSTSLLHVKYYKGPESIRISSLSESKVLTNVEAFCEVELSPMRFVLIQAQILTLIEYLTEGVIPLLVLIVSRAAAKPTPSSGDQLFNIAAKSFDIIVPQAANNPIYLNLNAANLLTDFKLLGDANGAEVFAYCTGVTLSNNENVAMVESPIKMEVEATLPSNNAPNIEDRIIAVSMHISDASFLLTRSQYLQILLTLEGNMSEKDSYLRINSKNIVEFSRSESSKKMNKLSHGGAEVVEIQKRISMKFSIDVLAIQLCAENNEDSILSAAAVKSNISIQLLPDLGELRTEATLLNLTMEDRRKNSVNRHFKKVINQVQNFSLEAENHDVFVMKYVQYENESKNIDLTIGSPQVIILPDIIKELVEFVDVSGVKKKKELSTNSEEITTAENIKVVCEENDVIEASVNSPIANVKTLKFKAKMKNITLIFIDMGSIDMQNESESSTKHCIETVVFQGEADASVEIVENLKTGVIISKSIQNHWERIEVFVAQGSELKHPVQIIEPSKFTLHLSSSFTDDTVESLDFKFVTLSPIEIIFSMQNAALLSAIGTSIQDFFESAKVKEENGTALMQLSEKEALNIEKLASALQESDAWDNNVTNDSTRRLSTVEFNSFSSDSPKNLKEIHMSATLPEALVTIVNDLQGLDQALFRIRARNVVCGGVTKLDVIEDSSSASKTSSQGVRFDFHMNSTFLAEYFDLSSSLWEPLLLNPWEITLKICRGEEPKYRSKRMMIMIDIEANSFSVSFSEKFLVSVGAALKMWSAYKAATDSALYIDSLEQVKKSISSNELTKINSVRRSKAVKAARAFVSSMPYGINNSTGKVVYCSINSGEKFACSSGSVQYFQFESAKVNGVGAKRVYGQDVQLKKSVELFIGEFSINIQHLDSEINQPRRARKLGDGLIVFWDVAYEKSRAIVNLTSHIQIYNETKLPFRISVLQLKNIVDIGTCYGKVSSSWQKQQMLGLGHASRTAPSNSKTKSVSTKYPASVGIPLHLFRPCDSTTLIPSLTLLFCPRPNDRVHDDEIDDFEEKENSNWGSLTLPAHDVLTKIALSKRIKTVEILCGVKYEDICRDSAERKNKVDFHNSLCIQLSVKVTLVDDNPYVEIYLQPRCLLENKLPISIFIRTPMPHTFSFDYRLGKLSSGHAFEESVGQIVHQLDPSQSIEIFTPGPSIAVSVTCADTPSAGPKIGWLDGEWIDLPLGTKRKLAGSIRCLFPFLRRKGEDCHGGIEFFVSEADVFLTDKATKAPLNTPKIENPQTQNTSIRSVCFTVSNFAVDYIENLLFEPAGKSTSYLGVSSVRKSTITAAKASPWSAFACPIRGRRITLLPDANTPIRLVELTIEGAEGMRRSLPFKIDEIAICGGGTESCAILWDDNSPTGYFAYRMLRECNQFEIRIVPEFVVFNGSEKHAIMVHQAGDKNVIIKPGKIAPVKSDVEGKLIILLEIPSITGSTAPLRVDSLGLQICLVTSNDGVPLGSIAVQTVVGNRDSRFVVKVGSVQLGSRGSSNEAQSQRHPFANDFVRARVRWMEMQVNLNDTQKSASVAQISLKFLTVDYQRIFKNNQKDLGPSERSQFALIIDHMKILDCDESSFDPVVLDSSSQHNFFELIVRTIGPIDSDLVKVELLRINIAASDTKLHTIRINTGETFVWKLIDVANRVLEAISEMSNINLILDWDESSGEYLIKINEVNENNDDDSIIYKPPRSDKLFSIKVARVSPVSILLTFRRVPQELRYKHLLRSKGNRAMEYFMKRLNFTIENASISFDGLVAKDIKGPPDRVIEIFAAVYSRRIQYQVVSLLKAVSLQDWKNLTSRSEGSDEYVEGDMIRLTGNALGRSFGFAFKKVGEGVGDSVSLFTGAIGREFQTASERVGMGVVGAGVNSVVSGLGDGVSSGVKGVTKGAGTIVRGGVKGVGTIVGGVGGGAVIAVKGVGKGVVSCDGDKIVKGLNEGLASVGNGVSGGVSGIMKETTDGIFHVGHGLFSGVRSLGNGIGGAFTGSSYSHNPTKKK